MRNVQHISSENQKITFAYFYVGLKKPSECKDGREGFSNISLSNLSSQSRDFLSIKIDQLSLSIRYSLSSLHLEFEMSVLVIQS